MDGWKLRQRQREIDRDFKNRQIDEQIEEILDIADYFVKACVHVKSY